MPGPCFNNFTARAQELLNRGHLTLMVACLLSHGGSLSLMQTRLSCSILYVHPYAEIARFNESNYVRKGSGNKQISW